MSTQLDALPVEMLAHVALFLDRHTERTSVRTRDESLLVLRSVSRACLDAVRRAIKSHPRNQVTFYRDVTTQKVTTVGAVLGSGCERLAYRGDHKGTSPEGLSALRQFVVDTQGRLRELSLCASSISAQLLLEICRACPQLKELDAGWGVPNIARADVDDLAAALSRSCPLLESVDIETDAPWSPAETYAMHFPNLKYLSLEAADESLVDYQPARFDKIEATARQCVGAETLSLDRCSVYPALAELLVRTPLQSRIKILHLHDTHMTQPTLLRLAAGLEALREIVFPNQFTGSPEFFASLARARPALKELHFGYSDDETTLDDACVAAICENFALEALIIDQNKTVTPAVVDIILRSPTAQTLCSASFYNTPAVNSAGILRLARGCPLLARLTWRLFKLSPLAVALPEATQHGKNVDDLTAILKERCRGHADWTFWVDPFIQYCPYPLAEKWRYRQEALWGFTSAAA